MSTDPNITSIDSTDPSPYIRTYAKDVAALTGQKPATGQPANAPLDTTPPFGPHNDTLLVSSAPSAQRADLAGLARDVGNSSAASKKETAQEAEERIQDLGGAASSGLLQSIALPGINPGDIILGTQASQPAEATESREALLARLRAKAAKAREASTPLMPSNFGDASTFEPIPVVPVAPPPPPEPVAPAPPEEKAPESAPFHSFSSDFADRIDEQHASTFSVLAAEDHTPKRAAPRKKLNLLPIIAGIILVIAGAGGVFAAYRFMTAVAPITVSTGSYLIVPDEKIALSGSGLQLLNALAQQAGQPIPANTVLLTYINTAPTTAGATTEATGGAFLTALNLPAPDILLRNINPTSMVGIVNDGAQTRAFFILRVDSYESTFAGMLQWEPNVGINLAALYPPYPAPAQPTSVVATSTATTTSKAKIITKVVTSTPVPVAISSTPQFIDEIVSNHNARALKDSSGRTIIIYGYADSQTLILARDEAAFTLLLNRLGTNHS